MLLDYRDDLDFVASSYSDYAYSASIGCWSFAASTPTFSRVFLIVNWYPVSLMSGERERERDCETRVSPHQQDTTKWHPPTPLDLVTFNPEFNVQTIRPCLGLRSKETYQLPEPARNYPWNKYSSSNKQVMIRDNLRSLRLLSRFTNKLSELMYNEPCDS